MRGLIVAAFGGESGTMLSNSKKRAMAGIGKLKSCAIAGTLSMTVDAAVAQAQEACVVCDAPAAIYRCSVEKSERLARFGSAGDKALQHVCAKEMARQGKHEKCTVRRDLSGTSCDGLPRMITLASLLEGDPAPQPAPPSASGPPPKPATGTSTKVEPAKPAPAVAQPPRTVQEMAERSGETSKQQLKDTSESIGNTAQRTWKCLTTLFQKC